MKRREDIRNFFSKRSKGEANEETTLAQHKAADVESAVQDTDGPSVGTSESALSHYPLICDPNDIGNFIGVQLSNVEKVTALKSLWKPDHNYQFPCEVTKNHKRHFQRKWLDDFSWLAYSKKNNGLYCAECVLFLETKEAGHQNLSAFVTKPFFNLKKALECFRDHEKHNYHKKAVMNLVAVQHLVEGKAISIDQQIDSQKKREVEENRKRLVPIVETIRLCGQQNMALRGTQDWGRIELTTPKENDGNFRSLLRYRAKAGDQVLEEHLKSCPKNAMYTSAKVQNTLIECFGHLIQRKIVEKVKESKFFSVLADETTDISQKEQFSLCVRYVDFDDCMIKEDFLCFVPVYDVTGKGLATVIEKSVSGLGLDMNNLRGQGYDGAAAMSGEFRGVQTLIKERCPKALYTHCVSHCLNLCLSDASKVQHIRNAMGVISECCTFFRISAKRTKVLEDKIKEILPNCDKKRLEKVCETRWCERHEAVILFKEMLKPIVAALEEMKSNVDERAQTANTASLLLHSIYSASFLVSLFVMCKLLSITYTLSKRLQKNDIDLVSALGEIKLVKRSLQAIRENSTTEFQQIFQDLTIIGSELGVEITIPRVNKFQKYRPNIPTTDPQAYYRASTFIPYLEDLISALEERFLHHEEIISSLHFVIPCFSDVPFENVRYCVNFYKEDLGNPMEDLVKAEWDLWRLKWQGSTELPATAMDGLAACSSSQFPNIFKLLHVLAILPVTTATVERSFSTLRFLKTYLRNTTGQDRLTGLALLYIHRHVKVTNSEIITLFAESHARRLQLSL